MAAARGTVGEALKSKEVNTPAVYAAVSTLAGELGRQVKAYASPRNISGRHVKTFEPTCISLGTP